MKKKAAVEIRNNNIRMAADLAEAMRESAKTQRKYIGVVWEEAARDYLGRSKGKEAAR